MKKILLILVLLAAAAYVVCAFFLGSIVKAGVNSFGPRLTQTKVVLGGASISPLSGSGTLTDFAVGNPKGWSDADVFRLAKIHVDVSPFSIFGDHVVINEITIDGPECRYETKFVASNVKDLLKNVEDFTGSGAKTAETKSGQPIKFVVKKLRITNGVARVGVGPAAIPVPLPPIAFDDLGVKEGGITADQLAGVLMRKMTSDIALAAGKAALQMGSTTGAATVEKTKEAAKAAGDSIKKLFNGKP